MSSSISEECGIYYSPPDPPGPAVPAFWFGLISVISLVGYLIANSTGGSGGLCDALKYTSIISASFCGLALIGVLTKLYQGESII